MTSKRRVRVVVLAIASLAVIGLMLSWSPLQWRTQVASLKLRGSLPEMTWRELYTAITPGNSYIDRNTLFSTGNLFRAISNPHTSQSDVIAGQDLFDTRCRACHDQSPGDGDGVGPDLSAGEFIHGSSDWAMFRNISHGIDDTAMVPIGIGDKEIWQIIAYVNSEISERETTAASPVSAPAPEVDYQRLVETDQEPNNWLTYSGSFNGRRFSRMNQIDSSNVDRLELKWVYQSSSQESKFETTPLVVDGTMYLTEPPNGAVALAVDTGKVLWTYRRRSPPPVPLCCGRVNRGLAVLDNMLYFGTIDAHLVALDAQTGAVVWDTEVADYTKSYSITGAPLALNGMIITGVGGGDYATRGFLAAYDARTGEQLWRFHTTPEPGEPGNETWAGDSWQTGGGATWVTGSFDPELNLIYWGTGNPAPDYNGESRAGDNLYTASVIALDANTGELRWYFQFTPHDEHDRDATQIPILVDAEFQNRFRKLMLWPNRNGFYYVLDRESGEYLTAQAFAEQNWADGIDAAGRPIVRPMSAPTREGTVVRPGNGGAANWWSPSYSSNTRLVYVPMIDSSDMFFRENAEVRDGELYLGGAARGDGFEPLFRALDYATGDIAWEFRPPDVSTRSVSPGGLLSTAGDVVFGGMGPWFHILDARNGTELERFNLGGGIKAAPITYQSFGTQQVSIAAGQSVFTFALGD